LAEAEAEAKSPFLGQTEAEAEDSVDHWTFAKELAQFLHMDRIQDSSVFLEQQETLQVVRQ
jgi:hypothetical protein